MLSLSEIFTSIGGTVVMDTTTEHEACVLRASKSGTITKVIIPILLAQGSPPNYVIRIEQVSASMEPNGTLLSAGAEAVFTPTSASHNEVTLDTPVSVSLGDTYSVRLQYHSGTMDSSNRAWFRAGTTGGMQYNRQGTDPPVALRSSNGGSSWSRLTDEVPTMTPVYSDGSVERFCYPIVNALDQVLRSSQNTRVGARFICPATGEIIGAWFADSVNAPRTMELIDLSGVVLGSTPAVISQAANLSATVGFVPFSPVSVSAGQELRMVWKAETDTSENILTMILNSQAARESANPYAYLCVENISSGWSDSQDTIPPIAPVMSVGTPIASPAASLPLFGGKGLFL